ncbi:MAG: 3-phosphoshikimate 1-carboxyvinyltransferase [Bacillales bacterium]|jgi:3-phosphoshikimate 1-carboxyvinyltransferase|nr:3-phosphoshikimate 1-carboxyvinyltransferase [Bacillales bacterium]
MNVTVSSGKIKGQVKVPFSKSFGHRAIIAGSLAKGESVIKGITFSNDINYTLKAMESLGAKITKNKDSVFIRGINNINEYYNHVIDCGESGSTLRFLIPVFSVLDGETTFIGKPVLFKRPLEIYEEEYKRQKLSFELKGASLLTKGKISAKIYRLAGNVSSQFITGLLFALPLLEKNSQIKIEGEIESEPYIDMTIDLLKVFGIQIEKNGNVIKIPGNQKYSPCNYQVEADYSQFAFFAVAGAINNNITLLDMNPSSKQGDAFIVDVLKMYGAGVEVHSNKIDIIKGSLKGCNVSLKNCPDLGPILMVLSLFANTTVTLTDIKRLRVKESDRVKAMVDNLALFKAKIEVEENSISIKPSKLKSPTVVLNPYNDHRILMALAILSTVVKGKVTFSNSECINKSYPNFFKDLKNLGIEVIYG